MVVPSPVCQSCLVPVHPDVFGVGLWCGWWGVEGDAFTEVVVIFCAVPQWFCEDVDPLCVLPHVCGDLP